MIKLLILLCFLIIASDASVSDFCVADYNGPQSAAGYSCKNPANVTVNDFVFAGLAKPGKISSLVKAAVTPATAAQFPGLNGLGISVARLDFAPGGFIPLHSHPGATEVLLVIKGSLTTGFIDSANQVFLTTLKKGELIIYPQGLLHFRVNTGRKRAVAFSSFSSQNPGLQVTASALFGNNLPSALIEETMFLDPAEVKKLKAIFGGTG